MSSSASGVEGSANHVLQRLAEGIRLTHVQSFQGAAIHCRIIDPGILEGIGNMDMSSDEPSWIAFSAP